MEIIVSQSAQDPLLCSLESPSIFKAKGWTLKSGHHGFLKIGLDMVI
jgi:hypothetical protein